MHKILGIVDSSCSLDLFEGELNHFELLHLLLDLISEHLVDKDMSEEYLAPILLVEVLVLDGSFCDFVEVCLSGLVGVEQLQFLLDHVLQVADVCLPLFLLHLQLLRKLFINFEGPVLFLSDSVALLFEDVQLFTQIDQFLFEIKFSLVVEYLVCLVATLHVKQHFPFSHC